MRNPFDGSLESQHRALVEECDRLTVRVAELEGEHKAWEETNGEVVRANFRLAARVLELLEALDHVRMCSECAETCLENCEGGRAALRAIQG